ncbi:MAG TPA: spore coat protein U domain-containing protein [Burkholderiales bacterium]|jgi:spore coat protein U-like protein|nr:spore coat protein U domain-containing protein [Burkholderiales bacterium]
MRTKRILLSGLVAAALGTVLCGNTLAGSAGTNLDVSASVAKNCTITTNAVAFGAYDPISTNAAAGADLNNGTAGSINLTCTKGSTGVTITLGLGGNASGSTRRMLGGTSGDLLTYELYQPSTTTPFGCTFPGTTVWGTAGANIYTPSGVTWSALAGQSFKVCGTVAKGQNVGADASYTDTVVATVNF